MEATQPISEDIMMYAAIRHVEYHLPEKVLDNNTLASEFEGWTAEKITEKTGIRERRISSQNELASDLAVAAAKKIFIAKAVRPEEVDFLLLCTQSPDYYLPTTACLVHRQIGLKDTCGALDFNLGCSGYVYGLGLAKGLIESGQAQNVLLVTAETYTKFIHPQDKSCRTIFGDGAAATLVQGVEAPAPLIGPLIYGTDGSGAENLIVPTGGLRNPMIPDAPGVQDESGNIRTCNNLLMNGPEIFTFTLRAVPNLVNQVLDASGLAPENVDLFLFHQANEFMLESLRRKCRIPKERFPIAMAYCGNTVSATLPILLHQMFTEGRVKPGNRLMLVGFGVGYSWAGAIVQVPFI